ncbi:NAD-dependent epimerase/dehydratase family protein [Psychroserpens sp. BH13MA-6]
MNQQIGIIGCGWLGFALAKVFIENGYTVHGSTTSESKMSILQKAGIHPYNIHLTSDGITGPIQSLLSHCETLIVNIPPGLRKDPHHDYIKQMTHFLEAIERAPTKHVLFIGSTSVYDDATHFPIITETSETSDSKTALKLLAVERLFMESEHFQTTILRFGGLFGEQRHPATYLSGKKQINNPEAPVNLIHRSDCIAIILKLIKTYIWGEVFNASNTSSLTKSEYYTSICQHMGIPIPQFDHQSKSKGKSINSEKLVRLLNYEFKIKP